MISVINHFKNKNINDEIIKKSENSWIKCNILLFQGY